MSQKETKTILIVDDEQDVVTLLQSTLERFQYEIISAKLGHEAVKYARCLEPDLILLDIILPDIDGHKVASILAKEPSTASIPILFLTGIITKKGEDFLRKVTGKYDVIAKPVSPYELVTKIESMLPAGI